ncbi:MAG: hypothetical protein V4539_16780 [Bacteroidota bacterium]
MEKRQWVLTGTFLLVIVFFAFVRQDLPSIIKGRVVPYNAALHVWAVSDKDTGSGVVQNGAFEIKNLKPGKYRVIAEGLRPYKVTTKPDINVSGGTVVDIGDIILDQ